MADWSAVITALGAFIIQDPFVWMHVTGG